MAAKKPGFPDGTKETLPIEKDETLPWTVEVPDGLLPSPPLQPAMSSKPRAVAAADMRKVSDIAVSC